MADTGKGENVGQIYYNVTLDTRDMIEQQRKVDRELQNTTRSLDGFENRLNAVTQAIKAYASAAYLIAQSDAYTKLTAQLKLATDNTQQFVIAQGAVKRIALEAQTAIGGVGMLYARITSATKELGVSQQGVADITRVVALALKVSGAGAAESASATLQLSQAFASGVLRGEEFNAVNEAAPRLMRALADGIGVPVGALRDLAEKGKLTSEVLAGALPKALKDLEVEAKSIQTIGGAFENLRTELLLFIGEQASTSGAAKLVADSITTLASNLDVLTSAAIGFVAAKLARTMLDVSVQSAQATKTLIDQVAAQQASRSAAIAQAQANVLKTQAEIAALAAAKDGILVAREQYVAELQLINAFRARGLVMQQAGAVTTELALLGRQQAAVTAQQTAATAALSAAQSALSAAQGAAGATATLASRALGLLGGPIGLITTVLGLGVTAWSLWGGAAKDSEQKATEAVERSTAEIITDLDKQISKLKERNALASAGMAGIAKQETEAAKKLATLQGQINNLMAGKGLDGGAALPESARVPLLQTLLGQYATLAGKIQDVGTEQAKLEAAGTASKLSQWMLKYANDTEKAREEIAKAKKELGAAFTPELEQKIRQKFTPAKPHKDRFDELAYLAGLEKQVADPFEKINIAEQEAMRKNAELLKKGEITRVQSAKAAKLIEENAAQDRLDIQLAHAEEMRKAYEDQGKIEVKAREKLEQEQTRGRGDAMSDIAAGDPIAALELELQRRLELNAYYASLDQANEQLYAQQRIALKQQTAQQITEIAKRHGAQERAAQEANTMMAIASTQSAAGLMLDVLKRAGKERTALGKALFLAERALAVATIIVNTEKGASVATGFGPFGIPMATMIRATGYASAGLVAGLALSDAFGGGRQYGGPVSAGSLYRVNETGRPEMYTASNGSQYMLPTQGGSVTPADKVGGEGNAPTVIIQNMGAPVQVQSQTYDQQSNTVTLAVAAVAEQISSNSGPVWSAMRNATTTQGRL